MNEWSKQDLASLYGLLHDIGKPLIRLYWIMKEESISDERIIGEIRSSAVNAGELGQDEAPGFENFARRLIRQIIETKTHESAWKYMINTIGLQPDELLNNLIVIATRYADWESASERTATTDILGIKHYNSPFLSPFGLASYIGLTTHDTVKLNLRENCESPIVRTMRKCSPVGSRACESRLKSRLETLGKGEDLKGLAEAPIWHPVIPIRWARNSRDYWARSLREAQKSNSYIEVNASLLSGLYRIIKNAVISASSGLRFDINQSLTAVYRRSLLFVPSAVYSGHGKIVLPELSLYAHSRVVAGLSAAITVSLEGMGAPCFRIASLDLTGIQRYISNHRSVSAAAKALRGRSLIVELAQRAAVKYILDRVGLPWTGVFLYEGGNASVIIPCIPDTGSVARDLEAAFRKEFKGKLGVVVGFTRELQISRKTKGLSRYEYNPDDPVSFISIMSTLFRNLSVRKYNVESTQLDVISPGRLAYDPFTDESIEEDYYVDYNDLCENANDYETYWRQLAGDDGYSLIVNAGGLSRDSYRALVAGSSLLNALAIIELYTNNCKDTMRLHANIANSLFGHPSRRFVKIDEHKARIGMIDFQHLNAAYIIISSSKQEDRWPLILSILNIISKEIKKLSCNVNIVISTINSTEDFLPEDNVAREITEYLKDSKASIAFDWLAINTNYPINKDTKEIMNLDDAAPTGLIGLVKMDADSMGGIMSFMSSSPSKLATASEILSVTLGLLGYKLFEESKLKDTVFVVYMGGDDAVFFGDLPDALKFSLELERHYSNMLPGSTISAGIAVGNAKLPVYLLYYTASRHLRQAKESPVVTMGDNHNDRPQGTVSIEQLVQPVTLCVRETCNNPPKPFRLNAINWRGPISLNSSFKIVDLVDELSGRIIRQLVHLGSYISEINDKYSCHGSPHAETDRARVLIAYAYLKEKLSALESKLQTLLKESTSLVSNYPNTINTLYERLKLEVMLTLARNPMNIGYHLFRIKNK